MFEVCRAFVIETLSSIGQDSCLNVSGWFGENSDSKKMHSKIQNIHIMSVHLTRPAFHRPVL